MNNLSFYDVLKGLNLSDAMRFSMSVSAADIGRILGKSRLDERDFLSLLSPAADTKLEEMARRAHALTLQHFGRTVQLYTPLYLSDYCENQCLYCSFSARHAFVRRKLSLSDLEREAAAIWSHGLRHLLILTGESHRESPVSYIRDCAILLRKRFRSLAIEVYPLTEAEYADLAAVGVDGLTIYQETYDEAVYRDLHPAGPKRNYRFRLEAPERGAAARMRRVTLGALLGLADWRQEVYCLGLHARYLMDRFPDVDIAAGIPRLRPHAGFYAGSCRVTDRHLAQIVLALRLFLPRLGISLSTREQPRFRDHLLPLGITHLSAGSITSVGGHVEETCSDDAPPQFEIADHRSVAEVMAMVRASGYDPVLSDWFPNDL